ncbi:hypothetical protein [Amycolatopsis sp. WAC 01375]|uniref:hypothetical protein n=1 Tax=Amycolatopsis sp. WAC 01375 TaxID=2203194 RepID=UPI000F792869|nr:hypothetical protein [Amycolatopsis sp. WAC 01375]
MTTSAETSTTTGAELLYLSVDLGEQPSLEDYERNVTALLILARYATAITPLRIGDSPTGGALPSAQVRVVRTSLASPWLTVLGDLARTSAPVGYGVTALYALHRLLELIMTWQRHRQDIAERDLQLKDLHRQLLHDRLERVSRLYTESSGTESPRPEPTPKDLYRLRRWQAPDENNPTSEEKAGAEDDPLGDRNPHLETVNQAANDLGEIKTVELIPPDDSRATGTTAND